jgi:hypothetical protein
MEGDGDDDDDDDDDTELKRMGPNSRYSETTANAALRSVTRDDLSEK